jgi:tRNA pseudouridine55 synthase
MLPICLGEATRLAGELLDGRKQYRFGLLLGERSATGDAEGAIIERAPVPPLNPAVIEAVLQQFRGPQSQIPPMYSALKRDGQPLYRLARAGVTVEREPRALIIDELSLLRWAGPELELRVLCSKGTYVRVLAEDIARSLGSCGRLTRLRRDYVEPFAGEPLASLEELERTPAGDWPLLPADRAVGHLPALQLDAAEARALRCGRAIALPQPGPAAPPDSGRWRLYDPEGQFLGLGRSERATLKVQRLFSAPLAV